MFGGLFIAVKAVKACGRNTYSLITSLEQWHIYFEDKTLIHFVLDADWLNFVFYLHMKFRYTTVS